MLQFFRTCPGLIICVALLGGGANLEWKADPGIVFFPNGHPRVFGLLLVEQGRFKPESSCAGTFNLPEMKSPLIEAVTRAGWNRRPQSGKARRGCAGSPNEQ